MQTALVFPGIQVSLVDTRRYSTQRQLHSSNKKVCFTWDLTQVLDNLSVQLINLAECVVATVIEIVTAKATLSATSKKMEKQ